MRTIWKYELAVEDRIELEMPRGAELLTVQTQAGRPRLWALVDPIEPHETRRFRLYGTGHAVSDPPRTTTEPSQVYVGTFQVFQGEGVFHLFEVRP